ncbi:phage late control D family protein, partial [Acinetobacter baumannii]|nr:phage late control D family protein [Acinetobacter baumannii]
MLSHIHRILEDLGISSQKRVLHVQFSNPSLNTQVFLQSIEGQHQLNEGLTADLFCLSINAHISLKQFIGCQVAVDQVTDQGQLFRTTGIITEASQGQSDGSLTLYKLRLQDPTVLWHKRRNSRVFMNKSVRDITE